MRHRGHIAVCIVGVRLRDRIRAAHGLVLLRRLLLCSVRSGSRRCSCRGASPVAVGRLMNEAARSYPRRRTGIVRRRCASPDRRRAGAGRPGTRRSRSSEAATPGQSALARVDQAINRVVGIGITRRDHLVVEENCLLVPSWIWSASPMGRRIAQVLQEHLVGLARCDQAREPERQQIVSVRRLEIVAVRDEQALALAL